MKDKRDITKKSNYTEMNFKNINEIELADIAVLIDLVTKS